MKNTIIVDQANKSYGQKQVLQNINLDVKSGQIFGLIGPSGAGKTTIVKLLVGMEQADSGKIEVLNHEMPNLDVLQEVGYMAQSDALYLELTGEGNLRFFASLFKLNKMEMKERIDYVAHLVNLTGELKKRVRTYSGGMKRRLSLAIALLQNPKILILDEPTVGIDPELRLAIWQELIHLKSNEGKTIIVTTHVMDEAAKCDRLAMVRDGRILVSGSPKELLEHYQVDHLEDVFLQAGGSGK